jgi:general secretion pathway protein D
LDGEDRMRPASLAAAALAGVLCLTAGCAPSNKEYKLGQKAQALQDYDTALVHYERALRADPTNPQYKISVAQMRFQAAQAQVELGQKLMARGDLNSVETALGHFQRALDIDPASAIANQMIQQSLARIAELKKGTAKPLPAPGTQAIAELRRMPPQLKPISTEPINLKMTNDARIVYETIAKLAGLTVLFDPDFQSRRISVQLPNVTLRQALDAVSLESKSFWKPVTSGIIFVAPDNVQKRREYEDEIVKTFYLKNTLTPQDLTEVVGGLRQLLQLQRVQQINSQNAIVIRDTPDKVAAAEKIIDDIDKQRAEVMLQVQVLEVNQNRLRDLGIRPGSTAVVTFTPRTDLQPNQSTSTTGGTTGTTGTSTVVPQITLNNLQRLSTADYSITLPGAALKALLTDSTTKIVQNPEIMITDGDKASLRIGDRVPIATGAFQAGVGVGVGTAGTSLVNPLVNTQFQYQDVGVNIDVTPRIHPDQDVSLHLDVEVSAVTGFQDIGGIQQPIISQRKIQNDIRLGNGQVSVLGGLVQHTTTKSVNGWPGFDKIPFLKYFFTEQSVQTQNDEVLIVITPHVVRMPDISSENMRSLFTGTQQNIQVVERNGLPSEGSAGAPVIPPSAAAPAPAPKAPAPGAPTAAPKGPGGVLMFEPSAVNLVPGQTTTIALEVRNAANLFSIPMILHYDPKVIAIEDVRNGGFLSGGTQAIAIFHHEDTAHGQSIISAMRPPKTGGVNGSGTLVGIVVKALAPGTSTLSIEQVSAKDPQEKPLTFSSQPATIKVGTP